ncbi:hypothetical protein DBV15_09017 [Temnothorax longispinosus]|uniref:Uncharacterized protein n=1 Tax=Temnothorax longispinosus TaxID=300112 RepID=A0A4S2KG80_9HYME|nr:hypothetical protein DBV15_09017 [Temnothorax longispinosus]
MKGHGYRSGVDNYRWSHEARDGTERGKKYATQSLLQLVTRINNLEEALSSERIKKQIVEPVSFRYIPVIIDTVRILAQTRGRWNERRKEKTARKQHMEALFVCNGTGRRACVRALHRLQLQQQQLADVGMKTSRLLAYVRGREISRPVTRGHAREYTEYTHTCTIGIAYLHTGPETVDGNLLVQASSPDVTAFSRLDVPTAYIKKGNIFLTLGHAMISFSVQPPTESARQQALEIPRQK